MNIARSENNKGSSQRLLHDLEELPRSQNSRPRSHMTSFDKIEEPTLLPKEDDPPEMTISQLESITFVCCLYSFFFNFVITIFLAFHYSDDLEANIAAINTSINGTFNRFQLHPILEMTIVTPPSKCPPDFEPILLDRWDGTFQGCYCPSSNPYKASGVSYRGAGGGGGHGGSGGGHGGGGHGTGGHGLGGHPGGGMGGGGNNGGSTGPRTLEDKLKDVKVGDGNMGCPSGCSSIYPETYPSDLWYWDGSLFCARRARINKDYVRGMTCPEGFKECSQQICLKESLACPITSINFTTINASNSIGKLETSGKYVTVEQRLGYPPLVDLRINMNSKPCFDDNGIPSGGGSYPLLKKPPLGCSKYGQDEDFTFTIDNKTQKQVFIENQIQPAFELIYYAEVLDATKTLLVGESLITLQKNSVCLNIDTSGLNEAGIAVGKFQDIIIFMIICGLVLYAPGIIICIPEPFNSKLFPNYFGENPSNKFRILYLIYSCITLFFLAIFMIVNSYYSKIQESKQILDDLVRYDCLVGGPSKLLATDSMKFIDFLDKDFSYWYVWIQPLVCLLMQIPIAILFDYKKKKIIRK